MNSGFNVNKHLHASTNTNQHMNTLVQKRSQKKEKTIIVSKKNKNIKKRMGKKHEKNKPSASLIKCFC